MPKNSSVEGIKNLFEITQQSVQNKTNNDTLTTRDLRERIITEVRKSLFEMNLSKYIKIPKTTTTKQNYDAHLKLTQLGKVHYKGNLGKHSKQIIHVDLSKLKIGNDISPIEHLNKLNEYISYAKSKINEFVTEI